MRTQWIRGSTALFAVGLLAALAGCRTMGGPGGLGGGQTTAMQSSPRVPAATGQVKTAIGNDGNTQFQVSVEHLAPPDRVQPGASSYVVWVVPEEGGYGNPQPQNAGALQVDRGKLTGSLKGVTPFRRFELMITAEPNMTTQQPTGEQVLTAQVYPQK